MESAGGATPVFCKARDVGNVSSVDLCQAMAAVVGKERVLGAQKIRGVWRLYISSEEARVELIAQGLEINAVSVVLYPENPYSQRSGEKKETIKITVKDIPLSYSNDEVESLLKSLGAKLEGSVQYSKARDSKGKLTDFLNGDRFVFADKQHLLAHPLKRFAICGLFECRIFHGGQVDDRVCSNCQKTGHTYRNCQLPEACMVCKEANHTAGSPVCSYYEGNGDCRTVAGKMDPLSNFYMCKFSIGEVTYHSSEQAYQYRKALAHGKPDLAKRILNTTSPYDAKSLSRYINCTPEWESENGQVMEEILKAKFHQVPAARQELTDSTERVIVEAVPGQHWWGSGMDPDATFHTRKEGWPGKNKLGDILMSIRASFKDQPRQSGFQAQLPSFPSHVTSYPSHPRHQPDGRRLSVKGRKLSGNVSESPTRRRRVSSRSRKHATEPCTPHGIRVNQNRYEDLTAESEGEPASDYESRYACYGSVK